MANFGNQTIPIALTRDWTVFWQLWNQNTVWDLEYYNGSEWISCKSDLQVIKAFPEEWLCKLTLKFTASHNANYRLTFAINKKVKDYVNKEAEGKYTITIDDDTLLFDWNDVLAIPNIQITHGVTDGFFWWRIQKDNVKLGAQITIDPIFGYDTQGIIGAPLENIITGSVFTVTENGTADSITAYVRSQTVARKFKCAIYRHSDLSLVGVTEEITLPADFKNWQTFNFTNPKPSLVKDTDYILVAWTEAGTDYGRLYYDTGATNQGHTQNATYDGFPATLSPTHSNYEFSIYCTYEEVVSGGHTRKREPYKQLTPLERCTLNIMDTWHVSEAEAKDVCINYFHVDIEGDARRAEAEGIKRLHQQERYEQKAKDQKEREELECITRNLNSGFYTKMLEQQKQELIKKSNLKKRWTSRGVT